MHRPTNITSNYADSKSTKFLNISEEQQVQIFAKQMLAKRMFVGHYQERRLVNALNSYRDIVCVFDTEDDLPRDLEIVKKRIQQAYRPHVVWTGITGPEMPGAPAGYCLWVKLNNIPFGHYWFQIREIQFIENMEICVRLKCIRPVKPDAGFTNNVSATVKDDSTSSNCKSSQDGNQKDTKQEVNETIPSFELQEVLSFIKNVKYQELILSWISTFSVLLTFHNLRQVMSFFVILIFTACTGFFKFVAYIGEFSIRVMREISVFVQVCTPIVLGIIDFFSKCVGGILILITMMWRGTPPSNAFPQNFRQQQRVIPALPAASLRRPPPSSPVMYRQNKNYARPL